MRPVLDVTVGEALFLLEGEPVTVAFVSVPPSEDRGPPHSRAAEMSTLGSIFIKPSAFDELRTNLEVDDFFLPVHREIFEAMLAIDKRRQALDHVAVADELKTRGMLGRLDGGESYLISLANAVPTAENALHYARLVREKATLRRLIAACAEVQSSASGDVGTVADFVEETRAKIEALALRAAPPAPPTADLVDRLVDVGDPLQTEFRTLDEACRGGFRRGRRVFIAGAPGSGKTTLALCWALAWARAGVFVGVLAADEGVADLLVRLGQMLGLDRDALEMSDPPTLNRLRAELLAIPTLLLFDGDEGATIETVAASVQRVAGDRPKAIVIDGLQTSRAVGSDVAESPRSRVDAVLAAIKRASAQGHVSVATSEMARGAYRSSDPKQRTDDIAAAKESGGIEYLAQTLLVLRPVPDRVGEIDVAIPKNRGGAATPFRLVLDFARASVAETARPADAEKDPGAADMERVREALLASPGVAGFDRLRSALIGMSMSRRRAAVQALRDAGEIVDRGSRGQPRLYLAEGVYSGLPAPTVGGAGQGSTALPTPLGGRAFSRPPGVDAQDDAAPVDPDEEPL